MSTTHPQQKSPKFPKFPKFLHLTFPKFLRILILIGVLCSIFGNFYYFCQVQRLEAKIEEAQSREERFLENLGRVEKNL